MPDAVRVVPCGGLQLELLLGSRARVRHPDGPVLTVAYSHKGGPKSPSNTKRVTGRNVIVKATVTGQRVTGRVVAAFGLGTIEEVLSNLTILPDERPTARDVPQGRSYPDEFYSDVAALYVWLVANGYSRPSREIGLQFRVSEGVAHRWLKEARARERLAPSPQTI